MHVAKNSSKKVISKNIPLENYILCGKIIRRKKYFNKIRLAEISAHPTITEVVKDM